MHAQLPTLVKLMLQLLALLRQPAALGFVRWPLLRKYHVGQVFTQLLSIRGRKLRRRLRENGNMPRAPKSKKKDNKFYAVRVGRTPGVYQTWDECESHVCQ